MLEKDVLGGPGDGGATQGVDNGALRAGGGISLAPEVLVESVGASSDTVILAADAGALLQSLGWSGKSGGA